MIIFIKSELGILFCRLNKKTAHAKSLLGKHVVLASRVCMSTCQPLADVLKGIKQHWATVLGAWPLLDLAPSCPLVCQTGMVEVQGAIKACLLAEHVPKPSYALQSLQCSILFFVNLWQQYATLNVAWYLSIHLLMSGRCSCKLC